MSRFFTTPSVQTGTSNPSPLTRLVADGKREAAVTTLDLKPSAPAASDLPSAHYFDHGEEKSDVTRVTTKLKGSVPKLATKGGAGTKVSASSCVQDVFSTAMPLGFTLKTPDNLPYKVAQVVQFNAISSSSVTEVDVGFGFSLDQIPNSSQFTTVFDQYMIEEIEMLIIPRENVGNNAADNYGLLYSVVDYDNASAVNIGILSNYPNCQVSTGMNGRRIKFKPHLALAAYQSAGGGGLTGYANLPPMWIDSAYPTVKHYGVKIGITQTDATYLFDIICKFLLKFRNVI